MKRLFTSTIVSFFVLSVFAQTQYSAPTYHQFNTNYGYLQIGPQNGGFAHIYTDRPAVIFNKPVYALTGEFSAYSSNNLKLQTSGTTRLLIAPDGNIFQYGKQLYLWGASGTEYQSIAMSGSGIAHGLIMWKGQDHAFTLTSGDNPTNMGVYGTVTLKINGGILCEQVKVITDVPNADYVFEKDYKLLSLSEIETFINKNKHLPNIPSAEEFTTKGYKVGEMDEMLLSKVEELTLHLIQLNKKVEELQKENVELRNKLN